MMLLHENCLWPGLSSGPSWGVTTLPQTLYFAGEGIPHPIDALGVSARLLWHLDFVAHPIINF